MQSEASVPLHDRYLWIEDRTSAKTRKLVRKGLPASISPNSRVCFVGYSYADLPLPKEFNTLFCVNRDECVFDYERDDCTHFRPHHLASAIPVLSRINAVTQQFAIPEHEISHGWKTICVVEFPSGVPEQIDQLPVALLHECP